MLQGGFAAERSEPLVGLEEEQAQQSQNAASRQQMGAAGIQHPRDYGEQRNEPQPNGAQGGDGFIGRRGGFVNGRQLGELPMVEVGFRQVDVGLLPKFLGGGAADVLSKIGAGESEAKMAGVFAG